MRKYKYYKESNIEWIGDIPSHWHILPFKRAMSINNGCDYKDFEAEDGFPVFGSGGVFAHSSKYLHDGEVVLLGRKGTVDHPMYFKGKFWTVDTMFYATPKDNTCCRYMYYQALTFPFARYSTSTAIPSMTQSDLADNAICVPPVDEQVIIADQLDKITSLIDSFITEKEDLKNKLQAYKQAIISESVTTGLNKSVSQKSSGIDWIGDIPSHWKVCKIGWLFSLIGSGTTPNTDNPLLYTKQDGVPWLQTGELNDSLVSDISKHVSELAIGTCHLTVYPKGSLVVAMYGATIGKLGILNVDACTNQACCVLANSSCVNNKFAFYALLASKQSLISQSVGGGQPNISQAIVKNHQIPVPPLEEQLRIVEYLDGITAQIDKSISIIESQIKSAVDYRQSVIFEAVTGKNCYLTD